MLSYLKLIMISIDNNNYELITILGPTASGKTKLAVELAMKINGEIISADSRQIYKGMDIGTGKDLDEYSKGKSTINYHLIDILDPNNNYSVYQFKNDFINVYRNVDKNKNSILCGGTGLYIESILLDYQMSNVKPNEELRLKLSVLSKVELIDYFDKINKNLCKKWKKDTKQRIIRGIEIALEKNTTKVSNNNLPMIKNYTIGVSVDREHLRSKIKLRLESRLYDGMISEVENLLSNGLPKNRLDYFGLEYKYVGMYLNKQLDMDELKYKLYIEISRFAKKQMTFFRRMEKRGIEIHWMTPKEISNKIIDSIQ